MRLMRVQGVNGRQFRVNPTHVRTLRDVEAPAHTMIVLTDESNLTALGTLDEIAAEWAAAMREDAG